MTDPQQDDENGATASMESLTWPDPSRPIIGHQPGYAGHVGTGPPDYQHPGGGPGSMGGMTENPTPPRRTTPDPVLFGPDPFPAPPETGEDEPVTYRRPKWPVVITILLLVMLLVGAMGIWVF